MQFFKNLSFCVRKSVLFNKGRYSRTRQIVKGTFFFSLLLNVNVIFGTLMIYYLYTIKLSHIWWFFYGLVLSFTVPGAVRRSSQRLERGFPSAKSVSRIYLMLFASGEYLTRFYKNLNNRPITNCAKII